MSGVAIFPTWTNGYRWRPRLHLAVCEKPLACCFHVSIISSVRGINQLQIDEIMCACAAQRAHGVELLRDLMFKWHHGYGTNRGKPKSAQDCICILRHDKVGLFCVAYLIVANFQVNCHPGFRVVCELHLERLHDIGVGNALGVRLPAFDECACYCFLSWLPSVIRLAPLSAFDSRLG